MYYQKEETNLTEFNSNVATLERIDSLLRIARQAMFADDFKAWFKALRNLKAEAIVKMNKEQKAECVDKFNKLETRLSIHYASGIKRCSFSTTVDNELEEFEIFLREIMNKKGMLLKDNEPDLRGL